MWRADRVLLYLDSHFCSPLKDPITHYVFSSTTSVVRSTKVEGQWVLRDGRVTREDEEVILADGRELGREIVARHDDAFAAGERLLASLRRGWLEALASDVGVRRSMPLDGR